MTMRTAIPRTPSSTAIVFCFPFCWLSSKRTAIHWPNRWNMLCIQRNGYWICCIRFFILAILSFYVVFAVTLFNTNEQRLQKDSFLYFWKFFLYGWEKRLRNVITSKRIMYTHSFPTKDYIYWVFSSGKLYEPGLLYWYSNRLNYVTLAKIRQE